MGEMIPGINGDIGKDTTFDSEIFIQTSWSAWFLTENPIQLQDWKYLPGGSK